MFTGADLQIGGLPCGWLVNSKDGSPMVEPPHPVLARGKVRRVGDPVAVVIAETLEQAKDAAEPVEVSYSTADDVAALVKSDLIKAVHNALDTHPGKQGGSAGVAARWIQARPSWIAVGRLR